MVSTGWRLRIGHGPCAFTLRVWAHPSRRGLHESRYADWQQGGQSGDGVRQHGGLEHGTNVLNLFEQRRAGQQRHEPREQGVEDLVVHLRRERGERVATVRTQLTAGGYQLVMVCLEQHGTRMTCLLPEELERRLPLEEEKALADRVRRTSLGHLLKVVDGVHHLLEQQLSELRQP